MKIEITHKAEKTISPKEVEAFSLRYDRGRQGSALAAATKRALRSECPVYVYPINTGWVADCKKPSLPYGHPVQVVTYDKTRGVAVCESGRAR